MHLIPLYDKIVIKMKDKQEIKSTQGLVYNRDMSTSKNTTMIGEVIAIGKGRLLSNGDIVPMIVKVGDNILFSKMQGESYSDETGDYTILSEQNVLSIIQEDKNENN